ncbi:MULTISPECIES: beta-phosphoglucomutase [unclassified Paenibacillus]|uniref:beta-phosphoglucomutase n=1 Tax=unclassified Paenibacillus TaxID=185978 RepID=UPI000839D12A|nr:MULTISPECIES: beta-phosphoglucomutase [unclassified Paenibacillus]NWL86922.1 beta-phosphoglucomutase [Paenibacillus sp. 79R4]
MKLQAVLFDLDGVITDTAEYHYLAWKQMAEQIGIEIDRDFNEQLKGISRMESLERILVHGRKDHQYSLKHREQLAADKNKHYVSLLAGLAPDHVYPGIGELLDQLTEHHVPSVLTSASKNAPQILESLGLADRFYAIADPDGISGKPAPDIFLKGAELAGADPRCCIGIEDAQAGIEAIKAAGMYAVGIGDPELLGASGADIVYNSTVKLSLASLLQALKQSSSL